MSSHDNDHHDSHLAPGDDPVVDGQLWEDPHHEHDHDDHHVHVIPFWTMFITFMALLALTALTVWTSRMYFGETIDLVLALFIASVKATLVCAYFMHLKYDKPLNTIVLISTLFGIVLFIGLTALDIGGRGWDDRRVRGEIHTGGKLELHAGTLPSFDGRPGSEPRPKAPMNIVDLARQHAEQMAANESLGDRSSNNNTAPADDPGEETNGSEDPGV